MFSGDFDVFLSDFGEQITLAGAPERAIFETPTAQALDVYGTAPTLTLRGTHASLTGQTAVVRGVSYTVIGVEPDGTGMTRARLERV